MDGSNAKKTGIEVSLVNVPRRPDCDIKCIKRHAASARAGEAEIAEYIGDARDINALPPQTPAVAAPSTLPSMSSAETSAPAQEAAAPAAAPTDGKVGQAAAAPAETAAPAPKKKDGDIVMQDVINVVVEQVRALFADRLIDRYTVTPFSDCIQLELTYT